ncbi:MAG: hypothetical protein GX421_02130 [Caldisericales bacterium]|nr:hypothetical protein [Caldisericales bacterium]
MKKILVFLIALSVLAPAISALAVDGTITVKPLESDVLTGSEIKVDIRASGLKDVYAISFELEYNNRLVQFKEIEEGALLKTDPKPLLQTKVASTKDGGKIFVGLSNIDGRTNLKDQGTIFTIKFKALISGKATIGITKLQGRKINFDQVELKGEVGSFLIKEPATKPILQVDPTELDFGTIKYDESKTLKVHVSNIGKEGLSGNVEIHNIWITSDLEKFTKEEFDLSIAVAPKEEHNLVVNSNYAGRLSIFTNGGSKDVICKFYLQDKTPINNLPPDLTVDEPKDGAIFSTNKIKLKGRTNPTAKIYLNGAPQPVASDGSFEYDLMLLEGENKIEVRAISEAGLEATKTIRVKLDTIKPVVSIKDPGEIVHSQTICVKGTTEPGSTVKVGGKPVSPDQSGAFSVCFDLKKGINELSLIVTDQAGNITEWKKTVNYVAQEIIKMTMWVGNPRAQVNGQTIYLDTPPAVKNGRTFVPVRFVSEKMKASVIWNQKTRSVTVEGKSHKCIVSIGSDTAFLDGDVVRLEAAPFIQGSSTMVPLRFIAQDTLGATISYDPKDKRIDLELVIEL